MAVSNDDEKLGLNDVESQFQKEMGHEPHTLKQMLSFCKQNQFSFKYKEINQWWTRRTAAIRIRKQYNTDSDPKSWKAETWLMIFSRSKQEWFPGKIEREIGENWLIVKYKKTTKRIQRTNKNLKPFPLNHPALFTLDSKCKIYSTKTLRWCDGEIIDVYNDEEGEWLKIKYRQSNIEKTCDIQRFSKDLLGDHDLDGNWSDDIKSMQLCDVENVIFYLRNNIFIEPQFTTKKFLKYKEKLIAYFYKNKIDGSQIKAMEQKHFVSKVSQYLDVDGNNKKLQNSFKEIFDLLTKQMEEMFEDQDDSKGNFS